MEDKIILTSLPLSVDDALRRVSGPGRGGVSIFVGVVRDQENDRPIRSITYEAYEGMAEKEMAKLVRSAEERWAVSAVAFHRVGVVPVSEASLVVACAGVHRAAAFAACRWVVDEVKSQVPIWKTAYDFR
ncbi:MAG: molybdenum cofactor biosynthesis protein MoaE [Elusimicrobia bacterium]|nr:molybdenum cofactor biosynthesis protein MoaE [Elusimicrobiota bacterium]